MSVERDVLQRLAMDGIAEVDAVAESVDAPRQTVEEALESLEMEGYVESDAGFWYLTDEGDQELTDRCQQRFTDAERDRLRTALSTFEDLDARLKTLAEEWQSLDDPGPSADPVAGLAALHDDVEAWLADLDESLREAYQPYVDSLSAALETLRDGETAYFTGTEVDSYHEVWFDLHEDILRTLGEQR